MSIAAVQPVPATPRDDTARRSQDRDAANTPPPAGFDAVMRVLQSAGEFSFDRLGNLQTDPVGAGARVSPDARADRLSELRAGDRAARRPTGSRIAGSQPPDDATSARAKPAQDTAIARTAEHRSQQGARSEGGTPRPATDRASSDAIRQPPQPAVPHERSSPVDTVGTRAGRSASEVSHPKLHATVAPPTKAVFPLRATPVTPQSPATVAAVSRASGATGRAGVQPANDTGMQVRAKTSEKPADDQRARRASASSRGTKAPEQKTTIDRIVKVIQAGARGKETVARIELTPPELGHVRVRMHLKNDVLQVRVAAETDRARGVLASQVDELRSALEQQDVKIRRLEIHGPATNGQENAAWGDDGGRRASPSRADQRRRGRDHELTPDGVASLGTVDADDLGDVPPGDLGALQAVDELRLDIRI